MGGGTQFGNKPQEGENIMKSHHDRQRVGQGAA